MANKKMGRPKLENPRNVRLSIRLTKSEKEIIEKKAKESNQTMTDYIVEKLTK